MRLRIKNLLIISMVMSLNACEDSAPSCGDSDVKKLVLSISEEKVLPYVAIEVKDGKKLTYGVSYIKMKALSENWVKMNIKKTATEEEHELWNRIIKLRKEAEEKLKYDIKITSIRTNSTDKIAKKCECSAQIEHKDIQPYQINYSAQYTEDNQVIVETY